MTAVLMVVGFWWAFLDGTRLVIRGLVELKPKLPLWPALLIVRSVTHWAIAAPWVSVPIVAAVWLDAPAWVLALAAAVAGVAHALVLVVPQLEVLRTWWRIREIYRRWPRVFNGYAGRTNKLQAMTGGEYQVSVPWRPIVDHPRLSWLGLPTDPGVVEFLVGAPPDRDMTALTDGLASFASRWHFVERVEVLYDTPGASIGRLRFTLVDDHRSQPEPERVVSPVEEEEEWLTGPARPDVTDLGDWREAS